jgi:hypothetical protein
MNQFKLVSKSMKEYGHSNFCAPLAHCIATDSRPENSLTLFSALGRKKNSGSAMQAIHRAFQISGYRLEVIAGNLDLETGMCFRDGSARKYGATFITASRRLTRDRKAMYLLLSRDHVQLVKHGEVHDWAKEGKHRIVAVIKINSTGE